MSNKITLKSAIDCLLIDLYGNTNLTESELNSFAKYCIKISRKLFEDQIKSAYIKGHHDCKNNTFKVNTYYKELYEH